MNPQILLGYYRIPVWYALEYVEKSRSIIRSDSVDVLVRDHQHYSWTILATLEKRIEKLSAQTSGSLKLSAHFPIERIESKHITFMSTALKYGWVSREIGETILPKFLREGRKDLSLELLKVMFDAKVVNHRHTPRDEGILAQGSY